MMKKEAIVVAIILTMSLSGYLAGKREGTQAGIEQERTSGQAVQERAAAIDACAREANVYPESCAMKAVVVSPSAPLTGRTAALPDLLPPPVES